MFWKMAGIRSKCSSPLEGLNLTLKSVVLYSRAPGTVRTYTNGFQRWKKWAVDNNVQPIPANPVHVSLFLTSILEGTSSHHSVRNTTYSIDWSHKVAGLELPSSHPEFDLDFKIVFDSNRAQQIGFCVITGPGFSPQKRNRK